MLSLISTPHFDDAALVRIQRDQVDIAVEAGSANTIWRDGDTHPTRRLVGAILIVREAHVAARRRIVVGEDIHIFQAKEAARARKRPHILHCPLSPLLPIWFRIRLAARAVFALSYLGKTRQHNTAQHNNKEQRLVKRLEPYYGRIELYAALAALGLAVIAGIYLAFTTIVEKEACYGISGAKVVCQPLTGENAVETVGRLFVILSIVFAMYAASAAAAWWQGRARAADARMTAYMILLTCALTVFGITFPAVSGVGFFFIPSMIVLLAAAGIGLAALLRANRAGSTAG